MKTIVQQVAHQKHTLQLAEEAHILATIGLFFRRLHECALAGSPWDLRFLSLMGEKYQPDEPEDEDRKL